MSQSLRGNPHHESSRDRNTHTNEGLIEATLALAFEQRTANLIAWTTACGETPSREIAIEIAGRLGL